MWFFITIIIDIAFVLLGRILAYYEFVTAFKKQNGADLEKLPDNMLKIVFTGTKKEMEKRGITND